MRHAAVDDERHGELAHEFQVDAHAQAWLPARMHLRTGLDDSWSAGGIRLHGFEFAPSGVCRRAGREQAALAPVR